MNGLDENKRSFSKKFSF
jgi:ectoine hydroxylase-related dioxygenase (phytanoyl-CoA dioxygenase family)